MPLRLISSNPSPKGSVMTTAQHQARVEPSAELSEHVVSMANRLPTTSTETETIPVSSTSLSLDPELVRAIHDEKLLAR